MSPIARRKTRVIALLARRKTRVNALLAHAGNMLIARRRRRKSGHGPRSQKGNQLTSRLVRAMPALPSFADSIAAKFD